MHQTEDYYPKYKNKSEKQRVKEIARSKSMLRISTEFSGEEGKMAMT